MFLKLASYQDYCLVYTSYLAINQLTLLVLSEDMSQVWLQGMGGPKTSKAHQVVSE